MTARLATLGLTLRAGAKHLVEDLAVGFEAGQNWAVLGANGSGKTTLLHTLAGLRSADHGEVRLDGVDIRQLPTRHRAQQLGILFQDTPPPFPATTFETVLGGRHPHLGFWQHEGPADLAAATAALAAVGLADLADHPVTTLSGGERRRMELACLLTQDPALCLLDEPINHLDPHYQMLLLRLVCARAQQPGHLNIFVLHDVNLALRFCSHGLLLCGDGRTRHGPLDTILDAGALESVYGCPMREVRIDTGRLFLPE
jgi:iron complex transport system ATP-binding protein